MIHGRFMDYVEKRYSVCRACRTWIYTGKEQNAYASAIGRTIETFNVRRYALFNLDKHCRKDYV